MPPPPSADATPDGPTTGPLAVVPALGPDAPRPGAPRPDAARPDAGPEHEVRDFAGAARVVAADLRSRLGLDTWVVVRTHGAQRAVVAIADGSVPPPRSVPTRTEVPEGVIWAVRVPVPAAGGGELGWIGATGGPRGLPVDLVPVEAAAAVLGALLSHEIALGQLERRVLRAEAAAGTDALTGLGNRRRWTAALTVEEGRAARRGSTAGVLVIDLDGLKQVNDLDGHLAGDELLRRAARVLSEDCRVADLVVRLGGDEFGVLMPEVDETGLVEVMARIEGALAEAGIAASLGGALRPRGGDLADTWARADDAMYDVKVRRRRARLRAVDARVPDVRVPDARRPGPG